jgi:hypothetical protein
MTTENNQPAEDIELQATFHVWQNIKAKFVDVIVLVDISL